MKKIAIIGGGNMGFAIAKGLLQGGYVLGSEVAVSDVSEESLKKFRQISSDLHLSTSNKEIVEESEIIILAVKPWLVEKVAKEIEKKLDYKKQIIVSIAAGVDFQTLRILFNPEAAIFRIIPNIAIEVLESVSTVCAINANKEQISAVTSLFKQLGTVAFVENEILLNAYMSLSSCGIAYAFRYIRAAMEGGVEMGIYPDEAKKVVLQTLKGAIRLLETNDLHPEKEIDRVTTPGGITIKGLNEMEANGFTNSVIKGLKKSFIG